MKAKKYLKGGQVKLDANKDGKISGADFSMLRKGLKKYQSGGKAPEGQSKEERMYLEIRKDAERIEKEMKRQGMSQAEINKKLDAYMEKAMSQAQYSKKKSYQEGGKAPKGEIDLGSTVASKYRLSLKDAEEMTDRVEKNYGRHASDIKTGYKGIDRRLEEAERNERQARARAGNTYYDGDGGGAARREKAYADRLGRRILAKMSAEKMDAYREKSKANEMKKGGKIVKYQDGNKFDPTPDPNTRRKLGSPGYEKGTDYSGVDKKPTAKEMLDSYETKRLRSALQAMKYPANKMSLAEMQKVSKKEGIYDKNRGLAREDYQKWLAKNR